MNNFGVDVLESSPSRRYFKEQFWNFVEFRRFEDPSIVQKRWQIVESLYSSLLRRGNFWRNYFGILKNSIDPGTYWSRRTNLLRLRRRDSSRSKESGYFLTAIWNGRFKGKEWRTMTTSSIDVAVSSLDNHALIKEGEAAPRVDQAEPDSTLQQILRPVSEGTDRSIAFIRPDISATRESLNF